jgi:hypothetical protein
LLLTLILTAYFTPYLSRPWGQSWPPKVWCGPLAVKMPTKGFHHLSQWTLDILNNIRTFTKTTFLFKNNKIRSRLFSYMQ